MALVEVDSKHWDIIDEPGRHLHDGASPAQGVQLPRTWRVFGPVPAEMTDVKVTSGVSGTTVAKPKVLPDIEQLAETPDQLTIDGKSYTGVDVGVVDNFLNLDAALNGHDNTEGYQAYAFARFSVSEETEVILGAGADWFRRADPLARRRLGLGFQLVAIPPRAKTFAERVFVRRCGLIGQLFLQ